MMRSAPSRPHWTGITGCLRRTIPVLSILVSLIATAAPVQAQRSLKLPGQNTSASSSQPPGAEPAVDVKPQLETIRQKIGDASHRYQEIRALLAAKVPPPYASFADLATRQSQLLSTRLALEGWQSSLEGLETVAQAARDLERSKQVWAKVAVTKPYPLKVADQFATELRSKHLELQTEQVRSSLEDDLLAGYRKPLEQANAKLRLAAEVFEKAKGQSEAGRRWLLESAEAEQQMAEAQLQGALAKVDLLKQRGSLLRRELAFLEEKLAQTVGHTTFTREDLEGRLEAIAAAHEVLSHQVTAAERLHLQSQERVADARAALGKPPFTGDWAQGHQEQVFELRQVEAGTAAQRVETLKLLQVANNLEAILWKERFRISQGIEKSRDVGEAAKNLVTWQERTRGFKDYFSAKAQLTRTQIQGQSEALKNSPEPQLDKNLDQAKLEAYRARMNDLEQLSITTENIDFLIDRVRTELIAKEHSKSAYERLQALLTKIPTKFSTIWNYEIFSIDDTIVAGGQIISGSRPVTLNKLIYGLLLLTVGIWLVGKVSKVLSRLALHRLKLERNLVVLVEKAGYILAVLGVVVMALGMVRIPITAFAFLGGALAIGVGFGGQNLINNFLSSIILLIEKPIKVGDIVEAEGALGRVMAIGGRCSTIRRFDGVDLLVPNSHLLEETVVNRTLSDNLVRYELKVGVAYGSPPEEIFPILEEVVAKHDLVLKEPKPVVLLEDFAADALLYGIYYWTEVNERLDVRIIASDLRRRIEQEFRQAGINIAYPQRDVHLDTSSPLKIQMVSDQAPNVVPIETKG